MNKMIKVLFCGLMLFAAGIVKAQDNVAYQDGTVRFTVVTDGVIRLEWQPEGRFTDLPSFVASERDYPEVAYKVRKAGKNVEITTSKMILTHKKGSGKFTKDNLVIKAVAESSTNTLILSDNLTTVTVGSEDIVKLEV